jgi:diketogulonate reductase-like aldo/keto reductase
MSRLSSFGPPVIFGTYTLRGAAATAAVTSALQLGYRRFDTASGYGNEDAVGAALAASPIPRSELFITTKISPRDTVDGFEGISAVVQRSLKLLQTPYIDCVLLHWPGVAKITPGDPRHVQGRIGILTALLRLRDAGMIRQVGVSNFLPKHLDSVRCVSRDPRRFLPLDEQEADIISPGSQHGTAAAAAATASPSSAGTVHPIAVPPTADTQADFIPAAIQMELHPWCLQRDVVAWCAAASSNASCCPCGSGVVLAPATGDDALRIEAYSPLGCGAFVKDGKKSSSSNGVRHGRSEEDEGASATPASPPSDRASLLLRWSVLRGFVPAVRSGNPDHQAENLLAVTTAASELESYTTAPVAAGSAKPCPRCTAIKAIEATIGAPTLDATADASADVHECWYANEIA